MRISHVQQNQFVLYNGIEVRVVSVFPHNKTVWISNLNQPLCGSISKIVKVEEIKGKP